MPALLTWNRWAGINLSTADSTQACPSFKESDSISLIWIVLIKQLLLLWPADVTTMQSIHNLDISEVLCAYWHVLKSQYILKHANMFPMYWHALVVCIEYIPLLAQCRVRTLPQRLRSSMLTLATKQLSTGTNGQMEDAASPLSAQSWSARSKWLPSRPRADPAARSRAEAWQVLLPCPWDSCRASGMWPGHALRRARAGGGRQSRLKASSRVAAHLSPL